MRGQSRRALLVTARCAVVSRRERPWILGGGLVLVMSLWAPAAGADVDVGKLVEHWRSEATSPTSHIHDRFHGLSRRGDGIMRLLVSPSNTSRATAVGVTGASLGAAGATKLTRPLPDMVPLGSDLYAWAATAEEVAALVDARPDLRVTWTPPRKVLLDEAVPLVRANVAHRDYGLTGRGVVVGIVDTGLDLRHADLRRADGTSRIAWLLDMSHGPTGRYPALEEEYGCSNAKTPCAIYAGPDLDELLSNSITGDEPSDNYGHGTHVTSLAAGNGLSSPTPKYVGMAPDATIVAVRATRDGGGFIDDSDILSAVKFIFHIADDALQQPAVVNLSLGGDFGAHDGTANLERALAAFVGPNQPGHSIVVAAGNSGVLYHSDRLQYPNPLGIHTVAHVVPESSVRVPLLIGESAEPKLPSQLYIWIASRPGDRLRVGFDTDKGPLIAPVDVGPLRTATYSDDEYTVQIQNGVTESDDPEAIDHSGAAVLIEGPFPETTVFALRLEGHGTATIWLQPGGGIEPSVNGLGALVPGAQREGTICVPATSEELIAVGASLNHLTWKDINGINQLPSKYLVSRFRQNEVLVFSAAGPTAVDLLKPDLVAPGGWVAGAMSRLADPRSQIGQDTMFKGTETDCYSASEECLVVDETHALSTGTSMASPIVAGAVALILERYPTLTQPEILQALQAGADSAGDIYASPSQVGAGILDVEAALWALESKGLSNPPDRAYSWIGLSNSYVHPDRNWPVAGLVHLRDVDNRPVEIDDSRLSLEVKHGRVTSALTRVVPGYYRFTAAGDDRSAGQTFRVDLLLDGKRLLTETRDIAVDAPTNEDIVVAGRGCALAVARRPSSPLIWLALVLGVAVTRRRKSATLRRGAPV